MVKFFQCDDIKALIKADINDDGLFYSYHVSWRGNYYSGYNGVSWVLYPSLRDGITDLKMFSHMFKFSEHIRETDLNLIGEAIAVGLKTDYQITEVDDLTATRMLLDSLKATYRIYTIDRTIAKAIAVDDYSHIDQQIVDQWIESGNGIGNLYQGSIYPIDHPTVITNCDITGIETECAYIVGVVEGCQR